MARVSVVHAMRNAVRPIMRLNTNMASRSYFSIPAITSLALAMKIRPPEIRQNETTSSDGGRAGNSDVGGETYVRMYVTPLARAAPTRRVPHCL